MMEGATPSSQALADRLIAAGYVGVLVRSFATGTSADEFNLVLWNWATTGQARYPDRRPRPPVSPFGIVTVGLHMVTIAKLLAARDLLKHLFSQQHRQPIRHTGIPNGVQDKLLPS